MKIQILMVVLGVGLVAGCSTMKLKSQLADGADMSAYGTFQIHEIVDEDTDAANVNMDNVERIQASIASALEGLGYEQSDTPDLKVAMYLKIEKRQGQYPAYYTGPSYFGHFYGYNYGPRYRKEVTLEYNEGTLIVDLVDEADNELVWQGIIEDEFFPTKELTDADIRQTIGKLFKGFPERVK